VHDAARVVASIEDARRAGFDNVSLDLMFWLPGQSRASWRRSIERAIALAPDHLSLYMLELYPNAPLRDAMARAAQTAPTNSASARAWAQAADDEAADMYLDALERLDAAGFVQYEISNVTRLGHESRHNLKYWTGGSWRGFGCGAHSTVDGERWHNLASTIHYVERIDAGEPVDIDRERLSRQARIEEALFTGLRLSSGIDRRQFETQYGIDPWTMYSERLQDAVRAGAIWRTADRFGLTRQGMLIANEVLTAFV
jgi:oxygen-independent coproporphyrinogen-3 oxidase